MSNTYKKRYRLRNRLDAMLIYTDSVGSAPLGVTTYKSIRKNRQRSSIRRKVLKRGGGLVRRRRRQRPQKQKKIKRVKKVRKVKRRARRSKKLNVKNIKFLKTLGFKVKKTH